MFASKFLVFFIAALLVPSIAAPIWHGGSDTADLRARAPGKTAKSSRPSRMPSIPKRARPFSGAVRVKGKEINACPSTATHRSSHAHARQVDDQPKAVAARYQDPHPEPEQAQQQHLEESIRDMGKPRAWRHACDPWGECEAAERLQDDREADFNGERKSHKTYGA